MGVTALAAASGFAHRGLHGCGTGLPVENSASAIKAAVTAGFGIELDVQMSRDAMPVVFHDETLERLTGETGAVDERSLAELAGIALRAGGDKLLSLAETLDLIKGEVPLLIEVKSHWSGMEEMEPAILAALDGYDGPVGIMSFDPDVIARLKLLAPARLYGLVTAREPDENWPETRSPHMQLDEGARRAVQFKKAAELSLDFIAHDVSDPDLDGAAEEAARLGLALFCWTVRDEAQLAACQRAGGVPIFEGRAVEELIPTDES